MRKSTFWIFTITVTAALIIPTLVQEGMFLDGITYSAVSKNMAHGYGTPLNPHYTKILYPDFHEQPPLALIIQSYFFKLLGDNFYTERIYCLFILILTIIGISKCWRLFTDKTELKDYDWFPVLLWITIPLVSWSQKNNLLENTMGVFTIFAVFAILKSLVEKKFIYLIPGSTLIVLAFLSKGFVGLFPIVVPLLYAVIYKPGRYAIFYTGYLLLFTIAFACITLLSIPALKDNLVLYMNQQLLPALNNQREITTENRFSILLLLLIQLAFPILVLAFTRINKSNKNRDAWRKQSMIYFLVAISASIPLIVSLKQRKYYLGPSIPFFILSISFLVIPHVKQYLESLANYALAWIKKFSLATLSLVILFSIFRFGKFSRDEEQLRDIHAIAEAIPKGTTLTTSEDLTGNWVLVAYMSRIGYLSLDSKNQHEYYLLDNNGKIENALLGKYEPTDLRLRKYVLLKKK